MTILRLAAVILALLFGYLLGVLQLIDVASPSVKDFALSIGGAVLVGAALHLGLFLVPSAIRRGYGMMLLCAVLMAPMPILILVQMGEVLAALFQFQFTEVAAHFRSDAFLYTLCIIYLCVFSYGYALLGRGIARRRFGDNVLRAA
jgi:hypothetical protein